jgi:hypothetical protein
MGKGKNKLVARVRNILLTPRHEWPVIAGEVDTVAGLYTRYILPLAAIPPVAGFLKSSLIGTTVPVMGTVRVSTASGLTSMVLQYAIGLALVYVLALIVDALAPTFGGQKDRVQALKTTAYASTASWVGGGLVVVPWLGWVLALGGGIYAIYLLYLGLPSTMRTRSDRALGYTAVTVLVAVVLSLVLGAIVGKVVDMRSSSPSIEISSGDSTLKIDADSATGKLEAWARKMEEAGKKMEEAQKSGDTEAQRKAAGEAMSAMFGGGDAVEALSPDQIKPFVPKKLGGLSRSGYTAERNTMMGVQVTEASARYSDDSGEHSVHLQITDLGGAKGLAALAGWAAVQMERESDGGYERVYKENGRTVREEWKQGSGEGEYSLLIGERFTVTLAGSGFSMEELKKFAGTLNLAGLEELKKSGVKPS